MISEFIFDFYFASFMLLFLLIETILNHCFHLVGHRSLIYLECVCNMSLGNLIVFAWIMQFDAAPFGN